MPYFLHSLLPSSLPSSFLHPSFLPSFLHPIIPSSFPHSFILSLLHPSFNIPSFPPSLHPSIPAFMPSLFLPSLSSLLKATTALYLIKLANSTSLKMQVRAPGTTSNDHEHQLQYPCQSVPQPSTTDIQIADWTNLMFCCFDHRTPPMISSSTIEKHWQAHPSGSPARQSKKKRS